MKTVGKTRTKIIENKQKEKKRNRDVRITKHKI